MHESNDMGAIPEQEIIKQFFPDGNPPKLEPVALHVEDNQLFLSHPNPGSTIIWKQPTDSVWYVYKKPFVAKTPLEAQAVRIGYKSSEILSIP